jgi:recombinational DNA repair protein (RecF pathway)
MTEQAGMLPSDIWFECSVCGRPLTEGSEHYMEDDLIYCANCWHEDPNPTEEE